MEIGSPEHKQLLLQMILKTAKKTFLLGLVIGGLLIAPSLIYSNAFSQGLAWGGLSVIVVSFIYASYTAWQKYRKTIHGQF